MNDTKTMLRFRESFRGYNKDDVNAYIEQTNLKFSRREAELRAEISDLKLKQDGPSEKDLDALSFNISSLTEENERLRTELEALKKSAENDSEKAEKSKLYDSMSSQVGNILIVANSNADKILSDAELEAGKIKAEAELEAERIKLSAKLQMDEMIAKLDEKLKTVSDSYLSGYSKLIGEAQIKFAQITDSMKARSEELLINADSIGKDIGKQLADGYSSEKLS